MMIPCDVHRDAMICEYKHLDTINRWTDAMVEVSRQLHRAQPPDVMSSNITVQMDMMDLLHDMFAPHPCSDLLKMMVVYGDDELPADGDLEAFSLKRNTCCVRVLYADVWIPLIYRLVREQWRLTGPFEVAKLPFQHLGGLVLEYLYTRRWPDVYFVPPSDCCICLDRCSVQRTITPCKHHFHTDCLLRWLEANNTCPVCRASLIRD